MLTAVDHLVIGVTDVAQAVETYRNLGFALTGGMGSDDPSLQAAYVRFGDFYIEFRGMGVSRTSRHETGEDDGFSRIVLRTSDLDAEIARLRSVGIVASDPLDDPTYRHGVGLPRRTSEVTGPVPLGLVEYQPTTDPPALGDGDVHPNTATVVERLYVAVEAIDRDLETFERLFGVSAPEPEMGTVIMSLMSVFYFGGIGIAVAEPRGPGPTATALNTSGPGLFQVLIRADHLDVAAELMVKNGLPSPTRGTRLSGESALLVEPANAANLYIAFAGQP